MNSISSKATHTDRRPDGGAGGVTTRGGEQAFDWAALVPLLVQPLMVEIAEAMAWIGVPLSAKDLSRVLYMETKLSHVSYYLRGLAKVDAIHAVCRRQVRGATETFYSPSATMLAQVEPPEAA